MDRVERTALISILINVGLVFLKLVLAVFSGSLALIADAWHSGSDVAASGLVWAGARISRREGRANLAIVENAIGLAIGALILWAAVGIFRRVSAVAGTPITNLAVAIGGALAAALISYYAAQYKLYVGRETGSMSLIADGYHSRMDTLTTGAVVVGLMGHAIGVELDRIAAAVVAIFVVESGVAILAAAVGGLRGGTAATPAPIARFLESKEMRAVYSVLERAGLVGGGRRLHEAVQNPLKRRRLIGLASLVVVAAWLLTAVYVVGPGRVGLVMRWGRALPGPVAAGMHVKAPWPVDRVVRVEVPRVRRIELGFRTKETPSEVTQVAAEFYATLWESRHAAGTYDKLPEEALRLTGDENIVDINVVVLYRVSDPFAFMFRTSDPEAFVRFASESAISVIVGSYGIDDVLTVEREALEGVLRSAIQKLVDNEGVGVEIAEVRLQDMHPPLEVVPAFRDVSSAREDMDRIINQATAYMNEIVPKARGDADRMMREAEGYRTERQDRALGDSDRFVAMVAEYRKARSVNQTRLYIETMESLLENVEKYIVSSDVRVGGYDLRVFDKSLGASAQMEK